ncbi:MAG: cytochrome c oxidase subunit 2 [Methyloligella sp.]|nr:MAG: cytochrome c oxidase subunit 2 [Methyloligella sp.]
MNLRFKNKLGLKGLGSSALVSALSAFFGAVFFGSTGALAAEGQPVDWQLGFQDSVTPIMDQIAEFHNLLLIIITVITLFVMALLVYVIARFNEKANPVPSKTTHSTSLEFAWTVVPILILLVISIPSWRLLSAQYTFPEADVTIKAIGNQWNWDYEYSDHEDISFTASMKEDKELEAGEPRLLSTDNVVVVPVNKVVHVLITADPAGVIHNWAVPSFGVKADAVPGRVTRTWFKARKTGMYYGQCSELCGKDHAFMPIQVKVVTAKEYEKWLQWAKEEYASNDSIDDGVKVAKNNANGGLVAKLAK